LGESVVFERAVNAWNSKASAASSRSGYGASSSSARTAAGSAMGQEHILTTILVMQEVECPSRGGGGSTNVNFSGEQLSSVGSSDRDNNNYTSTGSARNSGRNVGNSLRYVTGNL